MAKSMVACVLDTGITMRESCTEKASKLSVGITVIKSILTLLNSKSSEFGLLLAGSNVTNNPVNQNGVNELIPISRSCRQSITIVEQKVRASDEEFCVTAGLDAAVVALESSNANKKYTRAILLITDGETPLTDKIFDHLQSTTMPSIIAHDYALYVALIGSSKSSTASEIKGGNAQLLRTMVEQTKGTYIESAEPGAFFNILHGLPGLSVTPRTAKITLILPGTRLNVPCQYFALTQELKPALQALKKRPKLSGNPNNSVKRATSYHNPDEPDDEILQEEKVKGYKYGEQLVPVSKDDENLLQLEGPAVVELLCSLNSIQIPRYHFMESTVILQGDSRLNGAMCAVASLAKVLKEDSKAMLARFVKKDNADPLLVALFPELTMNGQITGALLMHHVPTKEEFRDHPFTNITWNAEPKKCIRDLIDALTVKEIPARLVTPFNAAAHRLQRMLRSMLAGVNYTEAGMGVNPSEATIEEAPFVSPLSAPYFIPFLPSTTTLDAIKDLGTKLATEFDIKEVVGKAESKNRVFWSDVHIDGSSAQIGSSASGNSSESLEAKRVRGQIQINMAAAGSSRNSSGAKPPAADYTGSILSVSTTSALDDFQAVMDQLWAYAETGTRHEEKRLKAEELFLSTATVFKEIITTMVLKGATQSHYKKAAACVQAFRAASIRFKQHAIFNDFLRCEIKSQFQTGKQRGFWELVVADRMSLITSEDDVSSNYSLRDSVKFLEDPIAADESVVSATNYHEEDNLFDELA